MAYAPTGILIKLGCTTQEVLDLRTAVKASLLSSQGGRDTEQTGPALSIKTEYGLSWGQLADECQHALETLDPETYAQDVVPSSMGSKLRL